MTKQNTKHNNSTSNVYLPLQLEAECIAEYVQMKYPTALNASFLLDTFLSVMSFICKKQLQFSELNSIILSHLAQICDKSNYHCIYHTIYWHIMMVAMAPFNLNEKESQISSLQAF